MGIQLFSLEYNILFTLTIILILSKLFLTSFLLKRILDKTKERGEFKVDFIFSMFLILLGLLISRIIYFYYDFFLTLFNPELLYIYPNVMYWKVAGLIAGSTQAVAVFFIDRILLKFKLKGIPAYILLIGRIVQFFYPINNAPDFQIASSIGSILMFILIILPVIFIYIGVKTPELRYHSFLFVLGIILYFISSIIVSEFILAPIEAFFGAGVRIIIPLISNLLKIVGLATMTYSSNKFYI